MRILIDLQGAQGSNRYRGIGRYSMSLAQAMVRQKGEHEILIALNGLFPETIEPIRAAFDGLLPQENIRVWYAPVPVDSLSDENILRRKSAELIYEAFLSSLKPDIVHVSSLFEGLVDDAVTCVGILSKRILTAVTLYDLIPYINRKSYLENPVVEAWYEPKIDHLRRANLLLGISESARQEGIQYLGFPEEITTNISTAADANFVVREIDSVSEKSIRDKYNIFLPFVMYTGGIDHRKNIEGLIRAYAMLPQSVRSEHQLAVVCSVHQNDRDRLKQLAREHGLSESDFIMTGFIPEEDLLVLYNLCKLFVFPSWHEGFGLPALEAMCCGRATIGANTSSIPEVIGRDDALFDPRDDTAIRDKILHVLIDDAFRTELERYGLERSKMFSWDESAKRAIRAFEQLYETKQSKKINSSECLSIRPRMAYISPLPPERSGISDYSIELLPELSRHYQIDVIVAQESISDSWVNANCPIRTVEWFREHSSQYDRVLYHFGNSHFHQHMFDLLNEFPGIVVLHDFFLSGIVAHMDVYGYKPHSWAKALLHSHGWQSVQERYHVKDTADVVWKYPTNLEVLQSAMGVIVHSDNSYRLAKQWYEYTDSDDFSIIPHMRVAIQNIDRINMRKNLKFNDDDFIVCSFGFIGPSKLNHRLLDAWLASDLATNEKCYLIFVGENHPGEYGEELSKKIQNSPCLSRIRITGWADTDLFRQHLAIADAGVQLRTLSRGETSGTVLDCMNYGLATIVNANGSMADLPDDGVLKLPDDFSDNLLINGLEKLRKDISYRKNMGENARHIIQTIHQPRRCAEEYFLSIERFYDKGLWQLPRLISNLDHSKEVNFEDTASSLAKNILPKPRRNQLLLDISELVQRDAKSGIQRVVRSILQELLLNPPKGWMVEPVYATDTNIGYRYARKFTSRFLEISDEWAEDEPIDTYPEDIFLGLDLQPNIIPIQKEYLNDLHNRGVKVYFIVYDLIPVSLTSVFPDGAEIGHSNWLKTISSFDGLICISRAVADEMIDWLSVFGPERLRKLDIGWFHLGADVEGSVPSKGLPDNASHVLSELSKYPTFLMVGTIEPRKGHQQVLPAFEQLWNNNIKCNYVIVGKQGWMVEELIEQIHNNPNLNTHLFWLDSINDEYLKKIYEVSTCLIGASEAEGFGLPLIEAAQYKIPMILRDIPVFREVAGEYAYYFKNDKNSTVLAETITQWMEMYNLNTHPKSDGMPWLTWKQSKQQLLDVVLDNKWYKKWIPDDIHRFWGGDSRLGTQVGKAHR